MAKHEKKILDLLNSHAEDPDTLVPLSIWYEAIIDKMGGHKEFAAKFVTLLDSLPMGSSQQVQMYNTILNGMQMLADRNVIAMGDDDNPVGMSDDELEAHIATICEKVITKDEA